MLTAHCCCLVLQGEGEDDSGDEEFDRAKEGAAGAAAGDDSEEEAERADVDRQELLSRAQAIADVRAAGDLPSRPNSSRLLTLRPFSHWRNALPRPLVRPLPCFALPAPCLPLQVSRPGPPCSLPASPSLPPGPSLLRIHTRFYYPPVRLPQNLKKTLTGGSGGPAGPSDRVAITDLTPTRQAATGGAQAGRLPCLFSASLLSLYLSLSRLYPTSILPLLLSCLCSYPSSIQPLSRLCPTSILSLSLPLSYLSDCLGPCPCSCAADVWSWGMHARTLPPMQVCPVQWASRLSRTSQPPVVQRPAPSSPTKLSGSTLCPSSTARGQLAAASLPTRWRVAFCSAPLRPAPSQGLLLLSPISHLLGSPGYRPPLVADRGPPSADISASPLHRKQGLGKTAQVVCFLGLLQHTGRDRGPHLVVCPASLLDNWTRELHRWCPGLRGPLVLHGASQRETQELLEEYARSRSRRSKAGGWRDHPSLAHTHSHACLASYPSALRVCIGG